MRGSVTDKAFSRPRSAGYGEEEVAEIVTNVAFDMFANDCNHVAHTELDLPAAPVLDRTARVVGESCGCAHEEVKR